jgi:proline dehydrogenase
MYAGSKAFFYALSHSAVLKRLASRHGLATPTSFASRFIAGETIEAAIDASSRLQSQGLLVTLDYLGERVRTVEESTAASVGYVRLLEAMVAAGIDRNISLKLTQLGVDIDHAMCVDNLRRILEPASRQDCFVRIDMENSPYTARTLTIFETLWEQQYRNVGVALQAYLHRTEDDIRRMNSAHGCDSSGPTKNPGNGVQEKGRNATFLRLARLLLDGSLPASPRPGVDRAMCLYDRAKRRRTSSSFSCSTASGGICRPRSSRPGFACASTCPSAANGSPTSCGGSASGRQTSPSS